MPKVAAINNETPDPEAPQITALSQNGCTIKQEVINPGEQVIHRKSERRRVARDIFLVFEEQPSGRRARGGHSRRQGRPKSKFGYLKVETPNKGKSLLRDIKNEPKCYLSSSCTEKPPQSPKPNTNESNITKVNKSAEPCRGTDPVARVNPIFLWVKQDDTRIVEVRCEDYDKRNRICITKTTNGWRAIPRTDPTSSRVVKFLQTPLLKVKREVYENNSQTTPEKSDESMPIGMLASDTEECAPVPNAMNCDAQLDCMGTSFSPELQEKMNDTNITGILANQSPCLDSKKNIFKLGSCSAKNKEIMTESEPEREICEELTNVVEATADRELIAQEAVVTSNREVNKDGFEIADTYHTPTPTPELRLCPRTGLFVPSNSSDASDNSNSAPLDKDSLVQLLDCDRKTEDLVERLDADSKNLKDLLDDADLLQHCDENVNSCTELIDSLVKRSCENNLIQGNDLIKDVAMLAPFGATNLDLLPSQKTPLVETIPQLMDTVSDPPKCLSFNEAGEIEGLNGELFQSNTFIDTFSKEPTEILQLHPNMSEAHTHTVVPAPLSDSPLTEKSPEVVSEETPKDLSYKKREEVCPPPESRSQCAVTSTSDMIHSPRHEELPAVESTSDTLKNLIIEQFIKMNTLNSISNPAGKQPPEPVDAGKQTELRVPTVHNTNNYAASSNYIETVVIDDNSDEEPVKKRLRNSVKTSFNAEEKAPIIDKDPDPLTQLQLLIRNTQWKVPDPILVPKERLGAVLASPAREIPLLITTRPELRLPEAFAYPEIIQNPNILVISMAQLEAILKNEMEMERSKSDRNMSEREAEEVRKATQPVAKNIPTEPKSTLATPSKENSTKCSHVESSLASDINAATLAVLNQMLWLPYFGQISQEFLKTLKDPVGMQNKLSSLMPLYTNQLALQQLDEMYKGYMRQMSNFKNLNPESPASHHPMGNFPNSMGAFQTPMELAVFQKLIQHQMQNLLVMNSLTNDVPQQREALLRHAANEGSSTVSSDQQRNRESKSVGDINSLGAITVPDHHNNCTKLPDKLHCVKKIKSASLDNATLDNTVHKKSPITKNQHQNQHQNQNQHQHQPTENKPRLTCKSLSNLLEPENVTGATIPLVNLGAVNNRAAQELRGADTKGVNSNGLPTMEAHFRNMRNLQRTGNPTLNTLEMATRQKKRGHNYPETTAVDAAIKGADGMNTDVNPSLWHPLFGSNTKTGYNSPWQWTTVTAAGE